MISQWWPSKLLPSTISSSIHCLPCGFSLYKVNCCLDRFQTWLKTLLSGHYSATKLYNLFETFSLRTRTNSELYRYLQCFVFYTEDEFGTIPKFAQFHLLTRRNLEISVRFRIRPNSHGKFKFIIYPWVMKIVKYTFSDEFFICTVLLKFRKI